MIALLFALACTDDAIDTGDTADDFAVDFTELELGFIQSLGPLGDPPADPTNAWAEDPDAAHLGRWLFFDARFSSNGEVSCATCHDPDKGFGDGLALSEGVGTTGRHAPTVWNTAYNRWYFWDGRADSHWAQALGPIESDVEHDFSRLEVARVFADDVDLAVAYERVFGAPLPALPDGEWDELSADDQAAATQVFVNFGKAIAAYERLLIIDDTPFDTFYAGLQERDMDKVDALSEPAQRGLKLFVGEGNCHFCHSGASFTDLEFHNVGLAPRDWLPGIDVGRYEGIAQVLESEFNGLGVWSDDAGAAQDKLGYLFQGDEHQGQFKVPTLRQLTDTAPYMHGGHFDTLEEVVRHYADLDEDTNVGHRDELIVEQDWSDDDVADMVAFLEALSAEPPDATLLSPPGTPIP